MQTAWTRVVCVAPILAACGVWACGGAKTSYDALFVRVEAQAGLSLDQVRFSVIQAVDGKRDVVPRDPEEFSAYTFATGGRDLASDPLVVKLLVGTRFQGAVTVVALGFQGTRVAARGVVNADLREKREVRVTLRGWPDGCDQDADGFPDCASAGCCEAGERFADCDDSEARATPVGYEDDCTRCGFGEALVGDGVDDDCDGKASQCRDQDGDQAIECLPAWCQEGGESYESQTCRGREAALDCDPDDATVFPGANEGCDGLDNDCDGQSDEEITFRDWDGAVRALGEPCGTGACAGGTVECDPQTKKARCSKAGLAAPAEVCGNQVDDNCNGYTDDPVHDGCEQRDTDGDGVLDEVEDRYCGPLAKYHAEVFPEYDPESRPDVPQGVTHAGDEPCCCGHDGTGACPELCDLDCDGACEGCGTTDADCDGFPASVDCNDDDATVHPGAPEKCGDGVDQDCKGGDQPCSVGADADKDWFLAGLGDCDDNDANVNPWATEVCNGRDDDCDGVVDDGNPGGQDEPCGSDVGECERGTMACTHAEGQAPTVACRDDRGPTDEACDGRDNDCDDLTDEDFFYDEATGGTCRGDEASCSGKRGVTEACDGTGECGEGVVECLAPPSLQVTCSSNRDGSVPQVKAEACNNADDDCDGQTDEDLTDVQQSDCLNTGVCGGEGHAAIQAVCQAGKWSCDYSQVPGWEAGREKSCDGKDNDCNGQTDEDFQFTDYDGTKKLKGEVCGAGLCTGGEVVCQADKKGLLCSSAGQAKAETCNNVDDDCDGLTDDGLTSVQESDCKKVGVCLSGMDKIAAVCSAGKWFCDYAAVPGYEAGVEKSCDSADNDCDGQTDEDFEYTDWDGTKKKKGAACGTGLCAGGVVVCKADLSGVTCSTAGLAAAETCNGVDQNCNGQTDEGTDSQCSDGKTCTDDKCQGGQCKNNLLAGNCLIAGTCYTDGTSNPMNQCQYCKTSQATTTWSNRDNGFTCDYDGDGCTQGDTCQNGVCQKGTAVDCSYLNSQCVLGYCKSTGATSFECQKTIFDGQGCNDGDACTKQDKCVGETCQGTPYSCNDNTPCTVDTCLGDGGCSYSVADNYCEIPQGSKNCVPINTVKPDNACLACLPAQNNTAWSPLPSSTGCDDGDACTIGDHCDNGTCAGTALVCEAWNPTCSEGECYCDVGPPAVQCDGATADTCKEANCWCGENPPCDPTSINPTCVGGTCQCGSTVCSSSSADACVGGACKCGDAAACTQPNPVCDEGTCFCDVGDGVQCDTALADTCAKGGTCQCGSNPACDPTSKNPTCSGGICKCGSTVCDDRSDRCTDGQCKCGTNAPCGVDKVCCPDLTCKNKC